ncbi:hypothetical protein [Streptomyces griseus]|uniref:hypothetical protein n=1 Tax=Streptomyces griseus TaxID=1911 RepID=UPI0004C8E243|nr:hypothetical protein [Streptomyces griseus]
MFLLVLFGGLGGLVALMAVVLWRRDRGRNGTESFEGLRIEEQARLQAAQDRVSYHSRAVHNGPPTHSDSYQRRR